MLVFREILRKYYDANEWSFTSRKSNWYRPFLSPVRDLISGFMVIIIS